MTTRERWTVYPLLLLAIGLALRGSGEAPRRATSLTAGSITGNVLTCKELVIVAEDNEVVIRAGSVRDSGGGRIEIRDASGGNAIAIGVARDGQTAGVEFFDPEGGVIRRLGPPRPAADAASE